MFQPLMWPSSGWFTVTFISSLANLDLSSMHVSSMHMIHRAITHVPELFTFWYITYVRKLLCLHKLHDIFYKVFIDSDT